VTIYVKRKGIAGNIAATPNAVHIEIQEIQMIISVSLLVKEC